MPRLLMTAAMAASLASEDVELYMHSSAALVILDKQYKNIAISIKY